MFVLPEARTRETEHESMRRLASTQSKYDGPNQNIVENSLLSCLSDHFKRKEKWSQPMATRSSKSHGCKKRSAETRQIPLQWTDGRTTKYAESLNGYTVGQNEWAKCLDYISKIAISHDALYRRRLRYESTVCMRSVDSNKQAGPLCQRPDYKSSAKALVNLQRAPGKGVPHIPINFRTRQNDTLDPAVQQHLEWLSCNWPTYFSSSSSSTWTESPTCWSSSSWDHQWQDWHSERWQDKEWWDQ